MLLRWDSHLMLNSFRVRLILAFLGVLTLVQLATGFSVLTETQRDNFLQQQKSLDVGANVFLEVLANRGAQLSQSLSVLSADFAFKRAIATQEQETIVSVLSNHGARIGADAVVLFSPSGDLLSSSLSRLSPTDVKGLFDMTSNQSTALTILNVNHASYQFVMQPVKAPTLIAWVGMGFLLDKSVAQQAKAITGIEVSFINQEKGLIEIDSTLDDEEQLNLREHVNSLPTLLTTPSEHAPENYLSSAIKLSESNGSQWAVLHQSSEKWLLRYAHQRNKLLLIFALTLALAIAIAIWLSGSLSRPVYQLVNYARNIGQGRKTETIQGAPAELQLLATSLSNMRDDIKAREQDLVHRSQHDVLTGLLNRFAIKQYLNEQAHTLTGSIVLLDIKHFRHINDIIGFANADALLVMFAQRLSLLVPAADKLARLDGDSFLLYYAKKLHTEHLLKSLDVLETSFSIQGSNISLTVRAGLLHIDGNDIDVLMRRAEIALNHASLQNLRVVSYHEGDDEKYQRELKLISHLPDALNQQQLYLVYQPKVDLRSGLCTGAEALIRWQHPELGFIPPDEFIQLAENSGNIDIVSQWVLTQAIAQLVDWRQQDKLITLSINLSAQDLTDLQLPNHIAALMDEHQLPHNCLCIEVTEGTVMKDPQVVIQVLQRFRALGLSVAIDDFGTGHSSLAYLKLLPTDEVKIDRSFIKDIQSNPQDRMIVDTSIRLIHGLGFTVVAEGVEDPEGVEILRQLDCDIIQGYVYSKPLKAQDFDRWFDDFHQQQYLKSQAKSGLSI